MEANAPVQKKTPTLSRETEDVAKLERSVLAKRKRLNALKHNTQTLRVRLAELQKAYRKMQPDPQAIPAFDAHAKRREEDAMTLRALENNLEKTKFKCKEAEKITANYRKLRSHLQDDSLTYKAQLDGLESEIKKQGKELLRLHVLNREAQFSKEAALSELHQLEEKLSKLRKKRERVLECYRRKIQELKTQNEKFDKRTQRTQQPEELSDEVQKSTPQRSGDEDKVLSTYEDALHRSKEATGLTDFQEILERFVSQKETQQYLEKMKEENQEVLQQLKEQKELLTQQFQDMKYSGEAKRSGDQQLLDELKSRLQDQQQKCSSAKEALDRLFETLSTIRGGMKHLVDKLKHVKPRKEPKMEDVAPESDQYVLVLIAQCDKRLAVLRETQKGKNLAAIKKEMEEEEFHVRITGKLPAHNTRIKLPEDDHLDLHTDDEHEEGVAE